MKRKFPDIVQEWLNTNYFKLQDSFAINFLDRLASQKEQDDDPPSAWKQLAANF